MEFDKFAQIIENHIRTVVAPQSQSAFVRFALGAAIGAGTVRDRIRPPMEALGVLRKDEGGVETVDTAKLGAALRAGFDATPELRLNLLGIDFTFRKSDAEALLRELGV
jgi:hypothetical protein